MIWYRPVRTIFALTVAALAAGWAGAADAARGGWVSQELMDGDFVDARLIASANGVGELATIPAGLQIRLPDGWKTYWRSPGEAGLPPAVDWTGSRNTADVRFDWPAPHRFTLFGIDTFGYADEVVFPLTVMPQQIGEAVSLTGRLDLLVCSDVCIPAQFDLSLDLPAASATADARIANLIGRFAAIVPEDGAAFGLTVERVAAVDVPPGRLFVEATAREPFAAPDVFVEAAEGYSFGAPVLTFFDDGRRLRAEIGLLEAPSVGPALAALPVTVTVVDGARTLEWSGLTVPSGGAGATGEGAGLAAILLLAILGGLILNLMPCVLPVLSLKLLSVLGHGGGSAREVRTGFLATAAGIVASFLVLAGAAIAAKLAGGAVGWGIQFQQPLFLIAMVVILTLFACNLLGFFEIALPSAVGDAALKVGRGTGLAGHFGTGAFATLLATPCSAPFLGTAVGFALSRGPIEILAVFLALGVGLALPYLAVAAVPRLATMLPRPGPWIVVMKRLLSLALIATALWLLSVLLVQSGAAAAGLIGGLMVAMGLLLWRRKGLAGGARLAGGVTAALLALAAFLAPLPFDTARSGPSDAMVEMDWAVFDRAAIDGMVADGRIVFVDVTADWCLTCQANKQLVLHRGAVAERLGADDVVPMRADWTLPDDAIAGFLASYGRYGIPFYVVYGPDTPDGQILPELLTTEIVLDAIAQARQAG